MREVKNDMYKVLIIDDEHLIRDGLMNTIDWKELGFDKVLKAANGFEAKKLIDQFNPHVIITDIKMPGMDGLQVTEYVMSIKPSTKVIILSGYDDFDYAQKAIKYGAFEFILKPSDYLELNKTIKMAVKKLKEEEKRDQEVLKLKEEFNARIDYFRQSFLKKMIISPQLSESFQHLQLEESLTLYNIPENGHTCLILAKVDHFDSFSQEKNEEEKQLVLLRMEQMLRDYFQYQLHVRYGVKAFLIPLKDDLYGVLVMEDQPLPESIKIGFCENLQDTLYGFPLTLSFGISRSKFSYLELNKAYFEALEALQYIFYFGNEAIILYSDIPSISEEKSEGSYLMYIEEIKPIIKALKIGDKGTCLKQLSYLFRLFVYNQESSNTVKSISIELMSQIKTLDRNNSNEELYMKILSTETNECCLKILEATISPLAENIHNKTRSNNKKVVEKVIDIIEQFHAEEISLTWVASKVHLNSSYVSRLIKKECGKNFTELLTQCRMEKAKQLLKDPTIKINEASEKVGILDAQYFSSKFKKYTGLTPSEYRDHFEDIFSN